MAKGKKKVKGFLSALLALTMCGSTVAFAACGNSGPYIGEDGYWYVNGEKTDVLAKGEKGDKGETGATGATGEKGDAGEKGETGDKGAQGNKGDKGETGDKGSTGKPGIILNGEGDLYKASGAITEKEGVVSPVDKFADGNLPYDGKFYMDYPDLATAQKAAHELAVQVAAEGDVLLKNEDGALPLADTERKVTLLGIRNARMVRSGFGSGAGGGSAISTLLADSMEREGFSINRKLLSHYTKQIGLMVEDNILELNPNTYGASLTSTYASYNDAAVLVFSRTGAENFDIATNRAPGYADEDAHKLQLDDNERLLVKHAKENFKKVIVVINSSNIMQIPELNAPKSTEYGVDAILWVGSVGQDGTDAIAKILTGEVNPSGHTVDLWEKDFKKSPTWTNFGTNTQNKVGNERLDAVYYDKDGNVSKFADVEYREGIYYGYKYYETRYTDNTDKEEAYENVLYPYGYGLSYTTFDWVLDNVSATGNITGADSQITMRVWVKNSGLVPGKDVVQVYYSAPYFENGIEKAAVNLVGFGKTKLLQPGESDVVTITFNAQDMASYDWNDANSNGFSGYELEAGDYKIVAAHNSHEAAQLAMGEADATLKTDYKTADGTTSMSRKGFSVTRTVAQAAGDTATNGKTGINCETDLVTGKKIENVYFAEKEDGTKVVEAIAGTDGKDNIAGILSHKDFRSVNASLTKGMISRSDEGGLKQPEPASKEDRTLSDEVLADWNSQSQYFSYQDKETDPWYVKAAPTSWDQATDGTKALTLTLADVAGLDYVEYVLKDGVPTLPENMTQAQKDANATWERFMNQFTWEELCSLPSNANNIIERLGSISLDRNGKPSYKYGDPDGPINAGGVQFPSNPILAATYNTALAEEEGRMVGNLLVLNGSGGWRGAGADIHRSPFSGRNFEYYSEDGVTSGIIGAAVTKGVTEKGIIAHFKHFFGNDQEAYRADYGGVFTWATEQQIREQMAKPFEYIIKYGGTIGLMNSFNRIGKWTQSTNFATHERLLNQEWDFKGSVEGDMWAKEFVPLNLGVRGGDDELLTSDSGYPAGALERGKWDATKKTVLVAKDAAEYEKNGGYLSDKGVGTLESPTHYFSVRKCAQRLLQTMANSVVNQNGYAQVETVKYTLTKGIYNSIVLDIPGKTNDATFTFKDDVVWPKGMTYNAETGILSGMPEEDTAADVAGTFTCDGWITKNPKNVLFKFTIETDLLFGTTAIANGGEVKTTAAALASGVTIQANQLKYGAQIMLAGKNAWTGAISISNQRITNAYCYEGKWYHRDEDKSAADILTLGQVMPGGFSGTEEQLAELDNYHLYGFEVEGLPNGLTATKVETDELGWMGKATYKVNTSLQLKGTVAAGKYTVTVTLKAPYVSKSTNPWMSPNDSELNYTVTFTIVVA
ncbi:MAG: hypothetical protein HFK09_00655 [Clostridia bacterium]|nr:hypothetical protein [Clostridia bacterium]